MGELRHAPKKHFGQHFLHDAGIIERIVRVIDPRPGDRLVEIGPGQGALTLPLLRRHGELTVIELDRDLIAPPTRASTTPQTAPKTPNARNGSRRVATDAVPSNDASMNT